MLIFFNAIIYGLQSVLAINSELEDDLLLLRAYGSTADKIYIWLSNSHGSLSALFLRNFLKILLTSGKIL